MLVADGARQWAIEKGVKGVVEDEKDLENHLVTPEAKATWERHRKLVADTK